MTLFFQAGHEDPCPAFYFRQPDSSPRKPDSIFSRGVKVETKQTVEDQDLNKLADAALVARMRSDPDALACLYDRYGSLVYAIALRVLRESTGAEDIVNEVFLQLWKAPAAFDEGRGKLASWLTVITRNKAVDILRKRRPEPNVPLEDAPPAKLAGASSAYFAADFEKARGLMESLPTEQRRVLQMAYLDGLTQSEISETLSEPLGTVKSRIRLGLNALKKALA